VSQGLLFLDLFMIHYVLPDLPYGYDSLEPYIDRKTMHVHHDGHHKIYVDKLNSALEGYPDLRKRVEELLASLDTLPPEIKTAVANNAGGHANHSLFWTLLTPNGEKKPVGDFSGALNNAFGSFSSFKKKFTEIAVAHFSNGWAWLCTDQQGKMLVYSSKDHENPIAKGQTPLLVLDLWEHAHYLKYQNRRPEYVEAFWDVVNWKEVSQRWDEFKSKGSTSREWRLAS
jgi:superoxide dismutase, Fe-Mn family